jgi:hypothetical protein
MCLLSGNRGFIDLGSMFTYPLMEESVTQICGVNTTFTRISSGYCIFPSKQISKSSENGNIIDWGSREYYKPRSAVREYFSFRKYFKNICVIN